MHLQVLTKAYEDVGDHVGWISRADHDGILAEERMLMMVEDAK